MPSAKRKGKGQVTREETVRYAVVSEYKKLQHQPNSDWSKKIEDAWSKLNVKLGDKGNTVNVKTKMIDMLKHRELTQKNTYENAWDNKVFAMVDTRPIVKVEDVKDIPNPRDPSKLYLRSIKIKDIQENKYLSELAPSIEATTEKDDIRSVVNLTRLGNLTRFRNEDNLDWIVEHEQEVLYTWITHIAGGNDKNNEPYSLNTFKDIFKGLIRYSKIMLGTDNELRIKLSVLYMPLSHFDDWKVGENIADETVVYFPDLLKLVDILEEKCFETKEVPKRNKIGQTIIEKVKLGDYYKIKDFNQYQYFLACAIMVWDYPSRSDKYNTTIIQKEEEATEKKTYLVVPTDGSPCKWIFREDKKSREANKQKNNKGEIIDPAIPRALNYNDTLVGQLQKRLDICLKSGLEQFPRTSLFINKTRKKPTPVSEKTVSGWVASEIPEMEGTGKILGINLFRHSFVSAFWPTMKHNQMEIMEYAMLTSIKKMMSHYYKKIDTPEARYRTRLYRTQKDGNIVEFDIGANAQNPLLADTPQFGLNYVQVKQEPSSDNEQSFSDDEIRPAIPIGRAARARSITPPLPEPLPPPRPKVLTAKERKEKFKKSSDKYESSQKRKAQLDSSPKTYAMRYVRELNDKKLDWDKITDTIKKKYELYVYDNEYKSHLLDK